MKWDARKVHGITLSVLIVLWISWFLLFLVGIAALFGGEPDLIVDSLLSDVLMFIPKVSVVIALFLFFHSFWLTRTGEYIGLGASTLLLSPGIVWVSLWLVRNLGL